MKSMLALTPLLILAACSRPAPPPDNARLDDGGAPIATRAVNIGSEGPRLPACPSVSRVVAAGTNVYWAPEEIRVPKAKLPGGTRVALCEASDDDRWFGVVFAGPDTEMDLCGVGRPVQAAREYQGPCRWGWIKGGTVELGR
ncbi:MAG: hypothetical protein HC788_14060 [Sphingopyxis sp.]|nr:hypothetical protein [Sphingopyxis sp.]